MTDHIVVGDRVLLHASFYEVRARLGMLARGGVLLYASEAAYGEGITGLVKAAGPAAGLTRLAGNRLEGLSETDDCAHIALQWEAIAAEGKLFTALDADLMLVPAGDQLCALALAGAYRPQPGQGGAELDRAMLRVFATAAIRGFLARVACALVHPAGTAGASRFPMAEATIAMPVRHEQFRIRGLRIHTQICGEGEPLLLYSGIWGQIGLWERLLPHLPGFQTIAFDPPGIGRSETPRYPQTMWALADFGSAVLDELGIESAHVLGASFGGAVAAQMAFSHPRRVRRLVLVSTSFGGFAKPGNLQALWHFIHPNAYHPERLERVAGDMFGGRLRTEPELVRSMHIKRPTNTLAALYRMSALFGWTNLPWVWAIRQPTLVIAGDDDPITPLVNHRVIAMLMPQATLRVMKGGGHLVLLDSAEQVGQVITSFLREG